MTNGAPSSKNLKEIESKLDSISKNDIKDFLYASRFKALYIFTSFMFVRYASFFMVILGAITATFIGTINDNPIGKEFLSYSRKKFENFLDHTYENISSTVKDKLFTNNVKKATELGSELDNNNFRQEKSNAEIEI